MVKFNYTFRTAESSKDIRALRDFIANQNLDYPRYDEWVQRAEHELIIGYKTGIMALSESRIVGNLIFQEDKKLAKVREIKNMRCLEGFRNKYFARFMLRQAETGLGKEFDIILGDIRAEQIEIINFMVSCGYKTIAKVSRYDSDHRDVILAKFARNEDLQAKLNNRLF